LKLRGSATRGLSKMAVEKTIVCPRNPRWLKSMLEVLPVGLRGKLEPYSECFSTPATLPKSSWLERRRRVVRPIIR